MGLIQNSSAFLFFALIPIIKAINPSLCAAVNSLTSMLPPFIVTSVRQDTCNKAVLLFYMHGIRNSQPFTATCSATCKHCPPAFGFHALSETVFIFASSYRWLICSFHNVSIFYISGCKNNTFARNWPTKAVFFLIKKV